MSQTIVITGASDGIGRAAAKHLADKGNEVILIGRDPEKTPKVARELGVGCYITDFSKLDDVRKLSAALNELPQIDVLANNAGGVQARRQVTVDGYEQTFQVNYLAPFLLTNLLLPKLIESHAKVINTSSAANRFGHVNLDDLNSDHGYHSFKVYGTTKLENIIFTRELAHRYGEQGIATAAFHPGVVASNFGAGASPLIKAAYHSPLKKLMRMKTVDEGADTLLWLIENDNPKAWDSGNYYADRKPAHYNSQVNDLELATELWNRSLDMVGLTHGTKQDT